MEPNPSLSPIRTIHCTDLDLLNPQGRDYVQEHQYFSWFPLCRVPAIRGHEPNVHCRMDLGGRASPKLPQFAAHLMSLFA